MPASDDRVDLTTVNVRRALEGDRDSLQWVVTRLNPLLVAQARHRIGPVLGERIDPEDIVAEAWMVALVRLDEFVRDERRVTPRLLAFLSKTIINKVNNQLKRSLRTRELSPQPRVDGSDLGPANLPGDDEATSMVTRAIRTERGGAIREALEALSETDRTVVLLRAVEGLDNGQAAHQLGELATTVSHRYCRALEKLRRALPDSLFDELDDE